jgi:hypothetical protein
LKKPPRKSLLSLNNGVELAANMSRISHFNSHNLLPLWSMANLPRHPNWTPSSLHHFRRLRLLPVHPTSRKHSLSVWSWFVVLLIFGFWFCCRRFVGFVFGDKARSLVLSIERCCCDRPNPVLQAILSKPTFFFISSLFCVFFWVNLVVFICV